MNFIGELTEALIGSADLVVGRSTAAKHFRQDREGLFVPLVFFVLAILLTIAVQSATVGMPSTSRIVLGLLVQAITLLVLTLAFSQLLRSLKLATPLPLLLVPTLWALCFLFFLNIVLSFLGSVTGLVLILLTGAFVFQTARVIAELRTGAALAFAIVSVLVLVAVPSALYMLLVFIPAG